MALKPELQRSFLKLLKGIKDHIESLSKKTETDGSSDKPKSVLIHAELTLPPAVVEAYQTGRDEENAREREKLEVERTKGRIDHFRLYVEIAVGIAVVITLGIVTKQWSEMLESNRIGRISAEAAKNAAETAADTLTRSIEFFRTDERAWIEIERIDPTQVSTKTAQMGAGFRYRIYLRNTGKTAAHGIVVSAARGMQGSINLENDAEGMRRTQDTIVPLKLPKEARDNPVPRVIAPGSTPAVPFIMDGQEPQIFQKGEWVSYLIGRVDYTDDFGVKHWMKFCFYVADGNGTLWNCHEGNDEDGNPEISSSPTKATK